MCDLYTSLGTNTRSEAASVGGIDRPPARGAAKLLGQNDLEEPPALDHPVQGGIPPDHQLLNIFRVISWNVSALLRKLGFFAAMVAAGQRQYGARTEELN